MNVYFFSVHYTPEAVRAHTEEASGDAGGEQEEDMSCGLSPKPMGLPRGSPSLAAQHQRHASLET